MLYELKAYQRDAVDEIKEFLISISISAERQ